MVRAGRRLHRPLGRLADPWRLKGSYIRKEDWVQALVTRAVMTSARCA
jgi:hypothetical protein